MARRSTPHTEKVSCQQPVECMDMPVLEPCTHEEADTRLMVHALDASLCGHRRIKIRSSDTDVVVLAISAANTIPADELWFTYGSGKNLHNLPVHSIAAALGKDKSSALPMFHALTECDIVSFFAGRGNKTAWDVWKVFPELTAVLRRSLTTSPENINEGCMAIIERFAILLPANQLGEARAILKKVEHTYSMPREQYFKGATYGLKPFSSEAASTTMSF